MAGRLSRGRIAGAGALLALALTPASAAAADRYVDAETGADSNTACPQANPCDTLAYALDNSSPGDQILVDNGSYPESVTVGGGRSLAFQNFIAGDGTGPAIVDGGADAAVTVPTSGAGHVRGLTVRGDITGIRLNGAAEVDSVVADDPDAIQASGIAAELGSDGSTIHDSTVIDPSPSTGRGRYGISVFAADVEVTGNQVSSMNVGISVIAVDGGVLVAQNEVTGTHSLPGTAVGIRADGSPGPATVMLRGNLVEDADGDFVQGIAPGTNVDLRRNEVTGQQHGIFIGPDRTDLTLAGDRVWGNTQAALEIFDNAALPLASSVSATNVTLLGGSSLQNSTLVLDSSIVDSVFGDAASSCTITHSRADAIGTDPTGCDAFQTTADPQFVDPDDGDLHLAPGSPMIDQGNPAAAAPETVDFDGDPRETIGTSPCVARRDIGADEFVPAPPVDCSPPETTIISGPDEGEVINERVPSIGYSSEAGATFQCSENGAAFGLCSHEGFHNLGPLPDGPNSFAVRAIDTAGHTDPTPDSVSFVVDTTEPDTTLTKKPPKKTTKKTVRFKFEADEPGTFTCQLDQKPAFDCESPEAVGVKVGRHKFRVTATDDATNVELEPAKYGFRRVGD